MAAKKTKSVAKDPCALCRFKGSCNTQPNCESCPCNSTDKCNEGHGCSNFKPIHT